MKILNKLENYHPCAAATPVTAKLLLLMLRDITDDHPIAYYQTERILSKRNAENDTLPHGTAPTPRFEYSARSGTFFDLCRGYFAALG